MRPQTNIPSATLRILPKEAATQIPHQATCPQTHLFPWTNHSPTLRTLPVAGLPITLAIHPALDPLKTQRTASLSLIPPPRTIHPKLPRKQSTLWWKSHPPFHHQSTTLSCKVSTGCTVSVGLEPDNMDMRQKNYRHMFEMQVGWNFMRGKDREGFVLLVWKAGGSNHHRQ